MNAFIANVATITNLIRPIPMIMDIQGFTSYLCTKVLGPLSVLVLIVGGVMFGLGLGHQDPHQRTMGLYICIGALVAGGFAIAGYATFA